MLCDDSVVDLCDRFKGKNGSSLHTNMPVLVFYHVIDVRIEFK